MIAIGCDHGGFKLKKEIINYLNEKKISFEDYGTFDDASVDYPDYAAKVAFAIQQKKHSLGILVCGTGIGMSIAANKLRGIRAAVVSDVFSAKATRLHNDANILCLGERVLEKGLALEIVDVFLNTAFEGGRHVLRLDKISSLENND